MSNNKKTKKALEKLKVKRAKYAAGGYGYTGGSRRKADSVAIKGTPVAGTPYKKGTGTVPETGPKPKKSDTDSLFSDPPRGGDGRQGPTGGSRGLDPSKDTRVVGNDGRTYFNQAEADKANERYAKKQAEPNPFRDAVMGNRNRTFGGYGNNGGETPPPQTDVETPDPSYLEQQDPASRGSVVRTGSVQTGGDPSSPLYGTPYPTPVNIMNPTRQEQQAITAWSRANGTSSTGSNEAPTDIKVTGPQANLRQMESVNLDVETGISTDIKQLGEATDATADTVTARELSTAQGDVKQAGEGPRTRDAERYTAEPVGTLDPTKAAEGDVTSRGYAFQAKASEAKETKRDDAAEEAAKGKFVDRPEYEAYAEGARDDSDYGFDPSTVDEPKVTISEGMTIPQSKVDEIKLDAENRGLDPTEALEAYSEAMVERKVQTARAAEGEAVELGTAPTETAAQADFLEAADVAAGRKEQIADAGEAGFAIREGRTAEIGRAHV